MQMQHSGYGVIHFRAEKKEFLLDCLLGLKIFRKIPPVELINFGAVYVNNQRIQSPELELNLGDLVRVHTEPRRYPKPAKIEILHEDENFLIVDKPSGIPVHPTVDNFFENLQKYLEQSHRIELFIANRLDNATQGLLFLAKNENYRNEFNRILVEKEIEKKYQAICTGNLIKPGLLTHYMEPSPRAPKKVVRIPVPQFLKCDLEVIKSEVLDNERTKYELNLITGRTHQIRAQLSHEGAPILGDVTYGSKIDLGVETIMLRCSHLAFNLYNHQYEFHKELT